MAGGGDTPLLTLSLHDDIVIAMAKRKESTIQIRVSEEEKEKIRKAAKRNGFDTVSSFILWLARTSTTKPSKR